MSDNLLHYLPSNLLVRKLATAICAGRIDPRPVVVVCAGLRFDVLAAALGALDLNSNKHDTFASVFAAVSIAGPHVITCCQRSAPSLPAIEWVKEWAVSGDIPPGWHLRMFGKVCALGKTIDPTVFGLREDDAATGALSRLMLAERALALGTLYR